MTTNETPTTPALAPHQEAYITGRIGDGWTLDGNLIRNAKGRRVGHVTRGGNVEIVVGR